MATVTGVTLGKMQEIQANTIISARVENGVLYFKKGDNVTEFSVGTIVQPAIAAWPVGSIFMSVSDKNPKELLGLPSNSSVTWVRWAQGRMPISLDPTVGSRFTTVEGYGGSERVALGINEMPAHNHGGGTGGQSADHYHTGYTSADGSHTHGQYRPNNRDGIAGNGGATVANSAGYVMQTDPAGYHSHSVVTYGASTDHTHAIGTQGGGASHENMPPYMVVNMWKRTQ